MLDSHPRPRLLGRARGLIGAGGQEPTESLRSVLRRHDLGFYPVIALGLLAFVDCFQGLVISTLGPEISRDLGVSAETLALISTWKNAALTVAAIGLASIAGRRPIRAAITIVTGFGWSIITLFTGFVRGTGGLATLSVLDGATSGSVSAIHIPLILDIYPPVVRVRITTIHIALLTVAGIVAPLLVSLCVGVFHLTWSGTLIVLAVPSLLATLFALGLRDPGYGKWETQRVRPMAHHEPATVPADEPVGFVTATKQLWLIPTVRRVIIATVVGSMASVPMLTYHAFWLDSRWGLDPSSRGILASVTAAIAALLALCAGPISDRLFGRSPRDLITLVVRVQFGVLVLGVLTLLSPWFIPMVVLSGLAHAMPLVIAPVLSTTIMNIVAPRLRPAFIALLGVASLVIGGMFGALFVAGLDQQVGLTWALILLHAPLLVGLLILRRVRNDINNDLDSMVKSLMRPQSVSSGSG